MQDLQMLQDFWRFEAARAISAFWKTHSCKLIPNWIRNRMITYTNLRKDFTDWSNVGSSNRAVFSWVWKSNCFYIVALQDGLFCVSFMHLLRVLIGLLDYLCPLWSARVTILLLVFRNSWCLGEFEKAVEAQYFSFFHSCFYNSKETRYMFSIS